MKILLLLFVFLSFGGYASAQWWGQNDWDKTPLNDFGFYNSYINKYKQVVKHSWDDRKFPWNHPDRTWTNIMLPWGRVGIGTITPEEKLHVVGNFKMEGMMFVPSIHVDSIVVKNLSLTNDLFAHRNILVDGNIGIGVTDPAHKLDIAGNLKVSESIFADSVIVTGFRTKGGSFAHLSVSNNLNVFGKTGLGVISPEEKLEVAGNIKTTQNLIANGIISDTASFAKGVKINGNLVTDGNISSGTIYTNAIKLSEGQSLTIDNNISFAGNAVMNQTLTIGTTTVPSGYSMAVKGKIIAEEIKVRRYDTWPDYVFDDNYKLKSLYQVEDFIKQHRHLEGIVTARQAEAEGVELGNLQAKLLEKVEELTLYLIELKKENDELAQRVAELEKQRK